LKNPVRRDIDFNTVNAKSKVEFRDGENKKSCIAIKEIASHMVGA